MLGAIVMAVRGWALWSRLGGWLSAVVAWAMANPWPALCVLAIAGNVAQLAVHKHDRATIAADGATIARVTLAQAAAARAAQVAHDAQQAAFVAKAKEADDAHQSLAARSGAAVDRFIADHRDHGCGVQPAPAGGAGGVAAAPSAGDSAGVPARLPADAIVVSARDVRACNAWVDYGIAAHDWAGTLNPP